MKLSQGEYVALEKLENVYSACSMIAQIYIHGDGLQAYLCALVVPDPIQFAGVVSKITGTTVSPDDVGALAKATQDPRVNAAVMTILNGEALKNGLKGCVPSLTELLMVANGCCRSFEYVKRIALTLDPFTVDNGTLTPTLKIKRKEAYNLYKKELDALYALGEPGATPLPRL